MNSRPPIPIPMSARWREFRVVYLPFLAFALLIGVIGLMWLNTGARGNTQGVGEGLRSFVAAPQTGQIQEWLVAPYSIVKAGTPLVVVAPVDPRASFDLLRSLFEMTRIRTEPSLAEDNAMNFERIRVELLRTKSELAIARVKLELAERDVKRNTPLYHEKLVSEDIYELSVNTRDALLAEVEEKDRAVAEIERRLEVLRPIGEPGDPRPDIQLGESLLRLEQAQATAARSLEPMTLVAPIDGMVGAPQRQAGEFVQAGEPLLAVNALRSDRVIGYLRQPYPVDPEPGLPVRITTKTAKPSSFWSHIVQVGAQIESITNSLGFRFQGQIMDAGLPFVVHVPDHIQIRPGEVVDLWVRTRWSLFNTATNQSESSSPAGRGRARL